MTQRTKTPAPATTNIQVVDLRWTNGVELRLPAANSAEYDAFLSTLPDYHDGPWA